MKTVFAFAIVGALGAAAPFAAGATPVVDYSGLVASSSGSYSAVGGVQFLNATAFDVGLVEVLLGGANAGDTVTLSIVAFDGGMGDLSATAVLGSVGGVVSAGLDYDSFGKAASADFSLLSITLSPGVAYGIVASDVSGAFDNVRGGSTTGNVEANVGALYNGDAALLTYDYTDYYEIPFRISAATVGAVPVPAAAPLLAAGLGALALVRRRRRTPAA